MKQTPHEAAGRKIKKARGLQTQQAVATAAGITVRHLIRLENGEHLASDRVLAGIAKATGHDLEWFRPTPGQDRASATGAAA